MIQTYLAPILQFLLLVGAVLQTAVVDGIITGQEAVQILTFAIAPAITYLVPLARGRWPGLLKTGLNAILGGLLVLGDVLANGEWVWSVNVVILIGLGVLNALAVEIGVQTRLSALSRAIGDVSVDNVAVAASDPPGYVVATSRRHLGT